jgi:hypothetical protein
VVVLEPKEWVGRRFPLARHIHGIESLDEGAWTVLLYHHNCPQCEAALDALVQGPHRASGRIALVELPPYSPRTAPQLAGCASCQAGRLDEARDWFAQTPVTLYLVNGTVIQVDDRAGQQHTEAIHP